MPVINRGQRLALEFGVSCGFIPAYSVDRIVIFTRRISSQLPVGRAEAIGFIAEQQHGFAELELPSVFDEWKLPVFRVAISSGVDKLFVVAICHFISVQQKI